MSSKVKSVTTLAFTLKARPRPRIQSLLYLSASTTLLPPFAYPPSGPGCSRWLTCTCCKSNIPKGTFFSSSTSPPSPNTAIEVEEEPLLPERPRTKTPHLPLPPTLPYSPHSLPFRRHLDILSLSLFSTPNESWSVYSALHPSLRKYIPDNTYRSLLSHQLKLEQTRLAWHHAKALLRLAKQCNMALEDLGFDLVALTTRTGLQVLLGSGSEKQKNKEKDGNLIKRLWKTLSSMVDDLSLIPLDVRRDWLKALQQKIPDRDTAATTAKHRPSEFRYIETAIIDLVERGGGDHLGKTIGRVLFHSRGGTLDDLLVTLRLMTWCISRRVEITIPALVAVMRKAIAQWSKLGRDGQISLKEEIQTILVELESSATFTTTETLRQAYQATILQSQSRSQKVLALLESDQLQLPGLITRGVSLASQNGRMEDISERLNTAIRLFASAARHRDSDCNVLIAAITHTLYTARNSPSIPGIQELIVYFTRSVYESQLAHTLPPETIIPLFRLIMTALPSHDAYILARKLYQFARAADPPFRWSYRNLDQWRTLFHYSIVPVNLHLHFASRLYADLMADGVPIRRTDALIMIRAVGMKPSPSRPILLERHIKDYLWMNYGRQPAFISAVVQGLTKTSNTDADLALNLAQRLVESQELQPVLVQLIIGQLSRSSNSRHRIKCFQLLRSLKPSPMATWCHNAVFSFLVSSARRQPSPEQLSHADALAYAIALYKEMTSRNVRPNARTISTMIRALLDSRYLDHALAVFRASIAQGFRLNSSAVGRLMVHLAIEDRAEEAYGAEGQWRSLAIRGKERSWDKGVVGARVLLDIKSGKEVDMEGIAKRTGWKGTSSFLTFLETLKPPSDGPSQQVELSSSSIGIDEGDKSLWSFGDGNMKGRKEKQGVDLSSGLRMGMGMEVAF